MAHQVIDGSSLKYSGAAPQIDLEIISDRVQELKRARRLARAESQTRRQATLAIFPSTLVEDRLQNDSP